MNFPAHYKTFGNWLCPAFTVEAFSARYLTDLQAASAEIVASFAKRSLRSALRQSCYS
jgi:hypothetical protein